MRVGELVDRRGLGGDREVVPGGLRDAHARFGERLVGAERVREQRDGAADPLFEPRLAFADFGLLCTVVELARPRVAHGVRTDVDAVGRRERANVVGSERGWPFHRVLIELQLAGDGGHRGFDLIGRAAAGAGVNAARRCFFASGVRTSARNGWPPNSTSMCSAVVFAVEDERVQPVLPEAAPAFDHPGGNEHRHRHRFGLQQRRGDAQVVGVAVVEGDRDALDGEPA